MKINNEYSHNGDLVIILEVMNDQIVLVSNEAAEEESEVLISELEPRSEAVRGFWNDGMWDLQAPGTQRLAWRGPHETRNSLIYNNLQKFSLNTVSFNFFELVYYLSFIWLGTNSHRYLV